MTHCDHAKIVIDTLLSVGLDASMQLTVEMLEAIYCVTVKDIGLLFNSVLRDVEILQLGKTEHDMTSLPFPMTVAHPT